MKKKFQILFAKGILSILAIVIVNAQVPAGFQYQAVARDAEGNPLNEQQVSLRLSLLPGSGTAEAVFTETHSVTTNRFGLITLQVGDGSAVTGDIESVDWSSTPMYLKVEMDPSGGSSYSEMGTSQLLSVPYALHAASGVQAPPGPAGPPGPQGEAGLLQAGTEPGNTPYWDGEQWVTGSSNLFNNGGNIGIGTTTPSQALDIDGNLRLRSHLYDRTNSMGTTGQVLTRTATGVLWNDAVTGTGSTGNLAYWSGTRQLGSIPYIIYSEDESVQIGSREDAGDDDPIFEVKNRDGQVVLGVYQTGVRIYVDEVEEVEQTKGSRAGFAVGGFSQSKQEEVEYLRIDPGTVRITVDEDKGEGKGSRGGFAVGGFTAQKQGLIQEFLRVTSDSVRIYVSDDQESKGSRGGFAVGGFTAGKSETSADLMWITSQNYFIGHKSGEANTDGLYNSFLGFESGMSNTTGSNNVFLGYQSGMSNTGGVNDDGSNNVFIGYKSGQGNTTGYNNLIMGFSAGANSSTGRNTVALGPYAGYNNNGSNNIFIGNEAGYSNTIARGNVFMGIGSGKSNTVGDFNVFIGNLAGNSNTEGAQNIFLGDRSGRYNTTGDRNVFIGNYAGQNNTTGDFNAYIGYEAGLSSNASFNSFFGYRAGRSNTSGTYNSFIGYDAGYSNTQGSNNVFIGNNAGYSNTTGLYNVFIGTNTGQSNTTAWYNTFIGYRAGHNTDEGGYNTIIGYDAGFANTTGTSHAFLGYRAGHTNTGRRNTFIGTEAGYFSYGGENNVYLGTGAGRGATGSNNVFIGYLTGYSAAGDNKLYIHNNTSNTPLVYGEFDNRILVFNGQVGMGTSPTTHRLQLPTTASDAGGRGVANAWHTHSDARVKSGVGPIGYGLDQIMRLSAKSYYHHSSEFSEGRLVLTSGENTIGLIAQDVYDVIPEVVHKPEDENTGLWSIDYDKLVPVLIEAMQQQQQQIEMLKTELLQVESLKSQLDQFEAMKARMQAFEEMQQQVQYIETVKSQLEQVEILRAENELLKAQITMIIGMLSARVN